MKRTTQNHWALVDERVEVSANRPVTADFLMNRYADMGRELAYPENQDPAAWRAWREALRNRLKQLIRLDAWGEVHTPEVKALTETQCDGYLKKKVAYETFPGNWVSGYLLVPDGLDAPVPAVLCPHGHVGVGSLAVVDPTIKDFGVAYGHEFARRGLVVLAPDNAGMGERDIPVSEQNDQRVKGCELLFRRLQHIGLDVTGLRVYDLMCGLSLLSAMEQVDSSRVGCAGLSGGCWLTEFLAALDERIRAVVLSGFMCTFTQTIWIGHCLCEHIYDIGEVCDVPDICALIAPRPMFVESGKQDRSFPPEPAYSMVERAYSLLEAEDKLSLDCYDGGHLFRGESSIPWMVRQLTKGGQG